MTIQEKITDVKDIKNDISQTLSDLGFDINEFQFSDYPTLIESIGSSEHDYYGTFVDGEITSGLPNAIETMVFSDNVSGGIGAYAFYDFTALKSISLPDNLTGDIGGSAFRSCSSLTSLTLPSGMTGTIGNNAFSGCSSLTSLNITNPSTVNSL